MCKLFPILLSRRLLDFAQISYRLWSHDARCTKVNVLKVNVTTWQPASLKNAISQARILCWRSNVVKIIPEPSATRTSTLFKVIRSNISPIIKFDLRHLICGWIWVFWCWYVMSRCDLDLCLINCVSGRGGGQAQNLSQHWPDSLTVYSIVRCISNPSAWSYAVPAFLFGV